MGSLLLRALGSLEALVDGVPVKLGGAKQRVVLACLVLRVNTVVPVDVLVEAVWGDEPPPKPAAVLQVYLANLRRALEPGRAGGGAGSRLVRQSGGYLLAASEDEVDLLQFRRRTGDGAAAAAAADLPAAARALRQAAELFRGPAFPDLADVELFGPELAGLEERRLGVSEDLFELELAAGRHAESLSELRELVASHPFRERLWSSLILALYRSGQQADALAACRDMRELFAEELGVDPGPDLQRLELAVLRQDPKLDAPGPTGRGLERRQLDHLPVPVDTLVGRAAELDEVTDLLLGGRSRLVTVTGPGGAGKTRFALAAATRIGQGLPDGVRWVELAPLSDAAQVPTAIRLALGIAEHPTADPLDEVTTFLSSRQLLLVLDNFEHVEQAWRVVSTLLSSASGVLIMVTSRQALQIRGEHGYDLPPLAVPPLDRPPPVDALTTYPSIQLFVERGAASRRSFTLTEDNAATVTRICRRLDGLPLAIELAAAQLRTRTEQALLDDLESSLTAMPATLRDLPDRQSTLAATLTWSHQLLPEAARDLFEQLGVFVGDPTPAAVQAICLPNSAEGPATRLPNTDRSLNAVANHSLLRRYPGPLGQPRLSLLQAVREFARERLSARPDASQLRRRHAAYFLSEAQNREEQLNGPAQAEAVQALHAEAGDLRAALAWASGPAGSVDVALALIGHLWHYWQLVGDVREPCAIATQVLSQATDAPPELLGPATSGAATLHWLLGRSEEAINLHQQALHLFRSYGDNAAIAWTLLCLSIQALEQGDQATARHLATEASQHEQASLRTQTGAQMVLGALATYANDDSAARTYFQNSLDLARETEDRWVLGKALINLADNAERRGDDNNAQALLRQALEHTGAINDRVSSVVAVEALAAVKLRRGQAEEAIRLLAAATTFRSETALPLNELERKRLDATLDNARDAVGNIRFALTWAAGETLTLNQAVDEALHSGGR